MPRRQQFLVGQLAMGRAGGMNHQALGVADVGQMAPELQRLDEAPARLAPALDVEAKTAPAPRGRYFWASA